MITHRTHRLSIPLLAVIGLLAAGVANAQRVAVTKATPETAERQTEDLLVIIEGEGFDAGSVVRFLLPGSKADTGGVIVDDARTVFRHPTVLGVYIDVDEFAVLG